jgi:hypothetical protein
MHLCIFALLVIVTAAEKLEPQLDEHLLIRPLEDGNVMAHIQFQVRSDQTSNEMTNI